MRVVDRVTYKAPCPRCGQDCDWVSEQWAGAGSTNRTLVLRCSRCEPPPATVEEGGDRDG